MGSLVWWFSYLAFVSISNRQRKTKRSSTLLVRATETGEGQYYFSYTLFINAHPKFTPSKINHVTVCWFAHYHAFSSLTKKY